MKKYIVEIEAAGWTEGSGWDYQDALDADYETDIIPQEYDFSDLVEEDAMTADYFEDGEYTGEEDVRYTVSFYAADDEDREEPVKVFKAWESEIWKALYLD